MNIHTAPPSTSRRRLHRGLGAITVTTLATSLLLVAPGTSLGQDASPAASAGSTRVVDTPAGPVAVPIAPERVVTVDWYTLPDLLELGTVPVGAPLDLGDTLLPDQLPVYEAMTKVGNVYALDFEAIAELSPDLIIGVDAYNADAYPTLSAIAPTVLLPVESSGDWPALAAGVADLLGGSDRLVALRTAYDDRAAALAADHADVLGSTTWAIVSGGRTSSGSGTTYAWLANSTTGQLMTDAGFHLAAVSAATSENGFQELSYEQLGELADADAILTSAGPDGQVDPISADMVAQPLFQTLPAAMAGHIVPVHQLWPASYGQAVALLDELDAALSAFGPTPSSTTP